MTLAPAHFEFIKNFIRTRSAIVLESGKEYMVLARLEPLIKKEGIASLDDLIQKLQQNPSGPLSQKVVEAMTTNETYFFRDLHPFEALKTKIFPDLITKRQMFRTLNIWCAACSSGQEPYSIAMILRENFPQVQTWNIKIIATDLSTDILARAKAGVYHQLEVNRGLPAPLLVKYFEKTGLDWKISDKIRSMVDFRILNLDSPSYPYPPMDLIFLRNVMIYFDLTTKKKILDNVHHLLKPDGYFFLGSTETTLNVHDGFERIQIDKAVCYRARK